MFFAVMLKYFPVEQIEKGKVFSVLFLFLFFVVVFFFFFFFF